ncbi:MAG: hypothetical protein KDA27_17310 [Candidatus Eisenbacteria bacterium]|uniref:Right-handed parallel beta-helix repeat-containing protein n=1 Tax=Eiseniibacteriota bacterium TaxID=2212470 RepID=A0A956SEC7_UNCEI|nr:hypothetical protein [Candidatus Eisenbacteria bacterium]MCB9466456.1 hypothetical protein [Candidatus Eisenbacteria bacterium]
MRHLVPSVRWIRLLTGLATLQVCACSAEEELGPRTYPSSVYDGFQEVAPGAVDAPFSVTSDTYLRAGADYQLGHVVVSRDATLLVGAGARISGRPSFTCQSGTIRFLGTEEHPIVVNSSQGTGIGVEDGSILLEHTDIRIPLRLRVEGGSLSLAHCVIDSVTSANVREGELVVEFCDDVRVGTIEAWTAAIQVDESSVMVTTVDCSRTTWSSSGTEITLRDSPDQEAEFDINLLARFDLLQTTLRSESKDRLEIRIGDAGSASIVDSRVLNCGLFLNLNEVRVDGLELRNAGLSVYRCPGAILNDVRADSSGFSFGDAEVALRGARLTDSDLLINHGLLVCHNSAFVATAEEETELTIGAVPGGDAILLENCVVLGPVTLARRDAGASVVLRNSILWVGSGSDFRYPPELRFEFCDADSFLLALGEPIECVSEAPEIDPASLELAPTSPCRDRGDWRPRFNDRDGSRNDLGVFGGPGAW